VDIRDRTLIDELPKGDDVDWEVSRLVVVLLLLERRWDDLLGDTPALFIYLSQARIKSDVEKRKIGERGRNPVARR
jgi:hypothetical protein